MNDRRVDEVTGERQRFRSSILPPWARKSPKVAEVLPLMYLHGMSSRDFAPALGGVLRLGGRAVGVGDHPADHRSGRTSGTGSPSAALADVDYVYVWVDGIHFNVRLDEDRLCALVIVGVRADGTKELVSITDGYRESTESWADVLRDLRRRGMRAPVVAVGDGALGFWAALRDVFPETVEARCWVHKVANVLNALPKSAQPAARRALAEIRDAEDRDHAVGRHRGVRRGLRRQVAQGGRQDRRRHRGALLAFFDFPAEHWIHLKTTNPIESTFATVRLRTKVTKGPGSKAAGLAIPARVV